MTSPLEMYSKFVLTNHACLAKSSENGQWPTAILGSEKGGSINVEQQKIPASRPTLNL